MAPSSAALFDKGVDGVRQPAGKLAAAIAIADAVVSLDDDDDGDGGDEAEVGASSSDPLDRQWVGPNGKRPLGTGTGEATGGGPFAR